MGDLYDFILNQVNITDNFEQIYLDVSTRFHVEIALFDVSPDMLREFISQLICLAHRAVTEFKGNYYEN